MDKIRERADQLLKRAEARAQADWQAMFADQAAGGTLGSGGTITHAVLIYSNCLFDALTQLQTEIGNQIDHRGRAWRAAIQSVQSALADCEARSGDLFAPVWVAGRAQDSGVRAGHERITAAFVSLGNQVAEFGEGWTAPRPKRWHERRPVIYAAFLLVMGAAIGAIGTLTTDAIKKTQQPAAAPVPTELPSHHPTSSQSPGPVSVAPSPDQAKPSQH